MDGIQYHNSKLDIVTTAEGFAEPMGTTNRFKYKYDLKDQLGSVHATIGRDSATQALRQYQEDEYYAFGCGTTGITIKTITAIFTMERRYKTVNQPVRLRRKVL